MTFLAGFLVGLVVAIAGLVVLGRRFIGLTPGVGQVADGAVASDKQQFRDSAVAILRSEDGSRRVVPSREESA
jgi:hypothetical protein